MRFQVGRTSVCILFTFQFFSTCMCAQRTRTKDNGKNDLSFVVGYMCPRLSPNASRLLSGDELAEDATCQTTLSSIWLTAPPELVNFRRDRIYVGSDILSILNRDNYRENTCTAFAKVSRCVGPYVARRTECLGENTVLGLRLSIGAIRTLCEDNFEETVTGVLSSVGDDCASNLLQKLTTLDQYFGQSCEDIGIQYSVAAKNGEGMQSIVRRLWPLIVDKCFLEPVQEVCGTEEKTQVKRLIDMFTQNFEL